MKQMSCVHCAAAGCESMTSLGLNACLCCATGLCPFGTAHSVLLKVTLARDWKSMV